MGRHTLTQQLPRILTCDKKGTNKHPLVSCHLTNVSFVQTKCRTDGARASLDVVREILPRECPFFPRHDAAQELAAEPLPPGKERRLPPLAAGEEPLAAQPLLLVPLPEPRVLLLDAPAAAPRRRRGRGGPMRLRAADAALGAVEPAQPPGRAVRPRRPDRAEPPDEATPADAAGGDAERARTAPQRRVHEEAAQPHRVVHLGRLRDPNGGGLDR